jgi:transposase
MAAGYAHYFIGGMLLNAVGIDVSKGKSMAAVMRPLGEIVKIPFEVTHTDGDLASPASLLRGLDGETRVLMAYAGRYDEPIARYPSDAGLFVCVIHATLIRNYGKASIRRVKTDKADAVKIANYGLDRWAELEAYRPENETRAALKSYNRQYNHYIKLKVMLKKQSYRRP